MHRCIRIMLFCGGLALLAGGCATAPSPPPPPRPVAAILVEVDGTRVWRDGQGPRAQILRNFESEAECLKTARLMRTGMRDRMERRGWETREDAEVTVPDLNPQVERAIKGNVYIKPFQGPEMEYMNTCLIPKPGAVGSAGR